ncbi:spore germination protein [Clostridium sp. DL1XJH146]
MDDIKKDNASNNQFNLTNLQKKLNNCSDVELRELSLNNVKLNLVFAKSMINLLTLNKLIISNLQENSLYITNQDALKQITDSIPVSQILNIDNLDIAINEILTGKVLILIEGKKEGLLLNLSHMQYKSLTSPEIEASILGSKDAFNEDISLNISLIRRRLKHYLCKFEDTTLGRYSQTKVSICYVENIVNEKLLEEVFRRLKLIDIDSILDASQIAELIEDEPMMSFPTICITEKPDKAVSALLEGRVVLLSENSPFALILPYCFLDFFHISDDYYNGFFFSTFIRSLRYIGYFFSVYLPGFYIAITSYHQELLQTKLLISIAKQREGIPFPLPLELLMMIFAFELIKEAGIRLPKAAGSALSIVGALIIGEAVVTAGLVSPIVVIITAITATSSIITSSIQMNQSIIIYRFISIFAGSMLGIWGVFLIILLQLGNLASIRSFGIPYTIPFAPLVKEDFDDILYRAPIWENKQRPYYLSSKNRVRIKKRKE